MIICSGPAGARNVVQAFEPVSYEFSSPFPYGIAVQVERCRDLIVALSRMAQAYYPGTYDKAER
jgi:hypothetical protein